jgi:prolipoprotein diacylglyceryl transferase
VTPLFIPSPAVSVWHLGPIPIRAYALCILAGIALAWYLIRRRWARLAGDTEKLENVLLGTVVCGIIGARLYYVLVEYPELFFGRRGTWYHMFYVWQGGLGIWGGLAVGALAAYLLCRHYNFRFSVLADCLAPAVPLAQALGRVGNYFNQELYGLPTDLPWGLEIDAAHRVAGYASFATFHPTFLYEALFNIALAAFLVVVVERRWQWGRGKLFATWIVGYAIGRFCLEFVRIDPAKEFLGLRIHAWASLVLGLAALIVLLRLRVTRPGPNYPDAAARTW